MLVQGMYYGRREVTRIYRARQIIWPVSGETTLDAVLDLFSVGYHVLTTSQVIVLSSRDLAVSVPSGGASALPTVRPWADSHSTTTGQGYADPVDAFVCVCDAASLTQAEVNALISGAVSFTDRTDMATDADAHNFVADAISGTHKEDSGTDPEANIAQTGAIYGDHSSDNATESDAAAGVADAVYGSTTGDNGTTSEATADSVDAVYATSQSANKTDGHATVMPFYLEGVVEMDAENESRTTEATGLATADPSPVSSVLRLVTTCTAKLLTAAAGALDTHADHRTTAKTFLHLEGEQPEESWYDPVPTGSGLYIRSAWMFWRNGADGHIDTDVWYDPVQTGNNLYIRSAWMFWRDGGEGYVDTDVWYEVVHEGNNLYIRSVGSFWRDGDEGNIDLSEFYKPRQEDGGLYIRSVHTVWTEGKGANIDTDFFLEPVQEGNNLYIRQNIFGGG